MIYWDALESYLTIFEHFIECKDRLVYNLKVFRTYTRTQFECVDKKYYLKKIKKKLTYQQPKIKNHLPEKKQKNTN